MFPGDEKGVSLDDQFYVGSSGLLVKPITRKDTTETTVYLSDSQVRLLSLEEFFAADIELTFTALL